jgi:cysteinyl-tRNA synthetase
MIEFVKKLEEKGLAYTAGGNVYFDTVKFGHYGELSHKDIAGLQHGARVEEDTNKHNPTDFVLWFTSSKFENQILQWDSPWGRGYPGWHIECSAMSHKYLGKTFDIHGGGVDLKFPHHENEIAQSKCADKDCKFAKYWVHNGFLMIEGQKMSKSLGNFITISDVKEEGVNGSVLRLALLSTHYRKPLNFTNKLLQDSEKMYLKFAKMPIDKEEYDKIELNEMLLSALMSDLNTTAYIGQINKIYAEKKYALARKMLEFIGIEF